MNSQNTATETPPPPTAESAPPNIAALPTPSAEEILREKLAERERFAEALKAERDALTAKAAQLTADVKELTGKLRELEKNPLNFALANLDAGQVLTDAGKALADLSAVVRRRDAKGSLTLKITVKPFKGDALVFVPEVKITEPKPEPAQSVFYADDAGNLSRNDPRQREFGF
jgi:type IV secretory pathway VirB10-like protein